MALHKQVPINNASAVETPQMVARRCRSAASPRVLGAEEHSCRLGTSAGPQPVPCPVLPGGHRRHRQRSGISIICLQCLSFQDPKGDSPKCHCFRFCRRSGNLSDMGLSQPLVKLVLLTRKPGAVSTQALWPGVLAAWLNIVLSPLRTDVGRLCGTLLT